jgi:hypothetical protein
MMAVAKLEHVAIHYKQKLEHVAIHYKQKGIVSTLS